MNASSSGEALQSRYPDDYKFDVSVDEGYDLLGNTVVVPVIRAVSERVLDIYERDCEK